MRISGINPLVMVGATRFRACARTHAHAPLALVLVFVLALPRAAGAQHVHDAPAAPSAELAKQLDDVRKATERYREHANAVADGYKKFGTDGPLMGEHWYHPDRVKAPLDLAKPATLQYATINGKRTLVGVAFNSYQRAGEALPEGFAGSTDHWHVHDMPKLAAALVENRPLLRRMVNRRAERGQIGAGDYRDQLVMVHAWVWSENPDGVFAQQHRALPYLRAGLPAAWAAAGDADAAWGVALLRDGCSQELERLERLARITATQKRELSTACSGAAATVKKTAADARTAEALNAVASRAWKEFTTRRDATLTAEQKRRLDAVIEPMHPGGH